MIVEGKNSVRESLASDTTVEKVIVQKGNFDHATNDIVRLAKEKKVRVDFLEKSALDKMSETGRHQGVIAVTTEFKYSSLAEVLAYAAEKGSDALVLVLDGVQDPANLGAIMRSAECLGAHGIIIGKHRSASVNETVIKASAGAAEHIRCVKAANINDAIRELKNQFFTVYAADMDGKPLNASKFAGNTAFVIGGEGDGVKRLTKDLCDGVVSIPMSGKINSLNASVAAGIVLYEYARQKKA